MASKKTFESTSYVIMDTSTSNTLDKLDIVASPQKTMRDEVVIKGFFLTI